MALDAATGSVVWSHQVIGTQPTTSAPAIDPNRHFVYAYGLDGFVHKYNVGSGNEVTAAGWPELVTLKTDVEKVAGSLTIGTSGGATYLYVVTDGYIGDAGDYQGHLTTINLTNGDQNVFNTLCSDNPTHLDSAGNNCDRPMGADVAAAVSGAAAARRSMRRPIASTSRPATAGSTRTCPVLQLGRQCARPGPRRHRAGALPDDSYTPDNFLQFDARRPRSRLGFARDPAGTERPVGHDLGAQLGKDAMIRLIDLDDMSGANVVGTVGGELQLIGVPQGGGGMSEQPAVWVDRSATPGFWSRTMRACPASSCASRICTLRFWNRNGIAAVRRVGDRRQWHPFLRHELQRGFCLVGADPVTGNILWTSGETIGNLHWQSPILVNGAIYIPMVCICTDSTTVPRTTMRSLVTVLTATSVSFHPNSGDFCMRLSRPIPCTVAVALSCASAAAGTADWMQFGYDAAHTGYNPVETTINAGNVRVSRPSTA